MKLSWRTPCLAWLAGGLLFACVAVTGCGTPADEPLFTDAPVVPTAAQIETDVARLHVGDIVTVTLTGIPEAIPPHAEPIKEDGTITMPSIGRVKAAGKTTGELQNEIHDLYVPKYYLRLTVTVSTGDRVYYVTGEVRQPGRLLYSGQMTVTKAITTAGGFTDFGSRRGVWLIRANGQRIKVNYDKASLDPAQDPLVFPNDQIQVPRRIF
jgi:protein involved in polysaccharide export with SLBB domain